MNRVKVLGIAYEVKLVKQKELQEFMGITYSEYYGATDLANKKILIFEDLGEKQYKETLRHEIIHAFFFESGLDTQCEFARNEELVDWLALQFPKIRSAFEDIGVDE